MKATVFAGPRIVGGEDAEIGEFPFQVEIYLNGFLCGGTLIGEEWVLSAAHCFEMTDRDTVKVILGSNLRDTSEEGQISFEVGYEDIIRHEKYFRTTAGFDVALIKLPNPVSYSNTIDRVAIAGYPQLQAGDSSVDLTAIGWGNTTEGGNVAPVLQYVDVPFVLDAICQQTYGLLADGTLCAGYADGGKDACQGDSGGPLVQKVNGQWVQRGIVSYGFGCARPHFYGIYTDVQHHLSWIVEQTGLPLEGFYPEGFNPTDATQTPIPTATKKPTATATPTPSPTKTFTPTPTFTPTSTPTVVIILSSTATPTIIPTKPGEGLTETLYLPMIFR